MMCYPSDGFVRECYFCGNTQNIERHHVFYGSFRKASERHGMTVDLCHMCHRGPQGVHFNRELDLQLKRMFQAEFEETHSHEEFMAIFKRNYL